MNRVFVRAAAVAVAVVFAGCSSVSEPVGPPEGSANLLILPFEGRDVAGFIYGSLRSRERLVVRTTEAWEEIWSRMTSNYTPQPPAPEVDFESEMVIIASMGSRPTGGFGINVVQVAESEGTVYVVVNETSPGSRCMTTQALTSPVTAVRVQRRDGPVTFLERESVSDCR